MQLFYIPDLKEKDKHFSFDKQESRHLIKVLRKKRGDQILVTNGKGYFFESEILVAQASQCEAVICSVTQQNRKPFKIHLAVAPTKLNDRYEWFLEKATEIGVDEITPIFCSNSERKVIKSDRYKKIIHSASKQSLRAHFPVLNPEVSFRDFVQNTTQKHKFIAHCEDTPKEKFKSLILPSEDILVMIGPEGDFSPKEIEIAQELGFRAVSLGQSRLRTETAAIAACHTIMLCNE